jgi:hypothetical protein
MTTPDPATLDREVFEAIVRALRRTRLTLAGSQHAKDSIAQRIGVWTTQLRTELYPIGNRHRDIYSALKRFWRASDWVDIAVYRRSFSQPVRPMRQWMDGYYRGPARNYIWRERVATPEGEWEMSATKAETMVNRARSVVDGELASQVAEIQDDMGGSASLLESMQSMVTAATGMHEEGARIIAGLARVAAELEDDEEE